MHGLYVADLELEWSEFYSSRLTPPWVDGLL